MIQFKSVGLKGEEKGRERDMAVVRDEQLLKIMSTTCTSLLLLDIREHICTALLLLLLVQLI